MCPPPPLLYGSFGGNASIAVAVSPENLTSSPSRDGNRAARGRATTADVPEISFGNICSVAAGFGAFLLNSGRIMRT
jgi:hypothetical protein